MMMDETVTYLNSGGKIGDLIRAVCAPTLVHCSLSSYR